MKYKKYISTMFMVILLLPFMSAKSNISIIEDFDLSAISFIDEDEQINLEFNTVNYLPKDFDPYQVEIAMKTINFMEEEYVDLGFETEKYLPENFDPYKK